MNSDQFLEGLRRAGFELGIEMCAKGDAIRENIRLRAECESLTALLLERSAERDAARQELSRAVTREAFDTVVRVQAQETSMKITAQRALAKTEQVLQEEHERANALSAVLIDEQEALRRARDEIATWSETAHSLSRKVGEAEDQLQRGRDYWHGRVEELMVANRTIDAAAASERPGVGLSRNPATDVTTIMWGSGDESRYVDEARFIEIAESREAVIAEVERLKGNLNRRDQNPYKRIDELMVQLEQSRKHLAASRTIRKRGLKNIQRLQQENLGLATDRDHWLRSFHEVEMLGRSIADWAYAEMNRREWGMIDRKVWNAIEDLRTTTRPEGS